MHRRIDFCHIKHESHKFQKSHEVVTWRSGLKSSPKHVTATGASGSDSEVMRGPQINHMAGNIFQIRLCRWRFPSALVEVAVKCEVYSVAVSCDYHPMRLSHIVSQISLRTSNNKPQLTNK